MKTWRYYTSKELKPGGWLRRQLELQAEGLCGNLDKVWPDVADSAWIGGKSEGWERVPYWLDGFIPMAYLLEREDLIATGRRYIDEILNKQREDGWICPCSDEEIPSYDTWAVQLISKTLLVYYECSGDERIPGVIYKLMRNYYDLLKAGRVKLFSWGEYRWFEAFIALNFLYERHHEDWIVDLARILKGQGADFTQFVDLWKTPLSKVLMATHIVGIAMMLKYEAVSYRLLGAPYTDRASYFLDILRNYNGTPVGLFTGDEHLNGLSPIQGTELCAVVEQMYSYEHLFASTGEMKWLELLEVLAFNALPATISDDMWAHQYDQLSNQIACIRFPRKPVFGTNNGDAHLFGLEPNYGCCTANFGQGWPKFALSAFAYADDTVLSAIPVPAVLTTDDYSVELQTQYPFENTLTYHIDAKKAFTFQVRIPSFAKDVTVDGVAANVRDCAVFEIAAGEKRSIQIGFSADITLVQRPHNLKTVQCGSLVFSLPVQYEKVQYEYTSNGVERKYPYCDYEYIGKSAWNYGYSDVEFHLERKNVSGVPFSSENPPVTVKAKMKKIPWGLERGYETVCAMVPQSVEPYGEEEGKELYPYGCVKLRMTEIPLVK